MEKYLFIAVGGALGSIARYWVGSTVSGRLGTRFPYGTFVINITACVIIGFALTYLGRRAELNPAWRFLIPVGFVGAYSTFSTYEWETLSTLRSGAFLLALSTLPAACFWASSPYGEVRFLRRYWGENASTTRRLSVDLAGAARARMPVLQVSEGVSGRSLQKRSESETHRLCNFHAWGLAAVRMLPLQLRPSSDPERAGEPIANGTQAVTSATKSGRKRTCEFASWPLVYTGPMWPIGCGRKPFFVSRLQSSFALRQESTRSEELRISGSKRMSVRRRELSLISRNADYG